MRIPKSKNGFPLVFVADDAFPLKKFMMKPYRARDLRKEELIFNYRLSRARRVVENAFGLMAMRFRVILNIINLEPGNAKKVVLACCILHNILRTQSTTARDYLLNDVDSENVNTGEVTSGIWRAERVYLVGLETTRAVNRGSNEAIEHISKVFKENFAVFLQCIRLPFPGT